MSNSKENEASNINLDKNKQTKWEYRIIHLNIDNNEKQSSNPTEASNKLGGSLSPEFLSKEFPNQYGESKQQSQKHPATQLQEILNLFGEECWELFEITNIGRLQMLFFKRKKSDIIKN